MKKFITVSSLISGLLAIVTIVMNFGALFSKNTFVGFAIFRTVSKGNFMGFMGNILGLIIMVAGFGTMCIYGLQLTLMHKESARKHAFISGIAMTAVALVSLFFAIGSGFNIGDLLILLFPAVYTICIFRTTDV